MGFARSKMANRKRVVNSDNKMGQDQQEEIARLRKENEVLKRKLAETSKEEPLLLIDVNQVVEESPISYTQPANLQIHQYSKVNIKIQFFRNLFRGREDVFAQRWEYPDGRKD